VSDYEIMIPELDLNDTGIQHDKDESDREETVTTSTMCDTPRL
jgi:hypothetical protein